MRPRRTIGNFGDRAWMAVLAFALVTGLPPGSLAQDEAREASYEHLMQEGQEILRESLLKEQAYQHSVIQQLPMPADAILIGQFVWRHYFEHHVWPKKLDDLDVDLDIATKFSDWGPFEVTAGEIRFRATNRKFPAHAMTAHIPLPTKEDERRYRKRKRERGNQLTLIEFVADQNPLAHAGQYARWNAASFHRRWELEAAYCKRLKTSLALLEHWVERALRSERYRREIGVGGMPADAAKRKILARLSRNGVETVRECQREAGKWRLKYLRQVHLEQLEQGDKSPLPNP